MMERRSQNETTLDVGSDDPARADLPRSEFRVAISRQLSYPRHVVPNNGSAHRVWPVAAVSPGHRSFGIPGQ